jgi:hypothetical protein
VSEVPKVERLVMFKHGVAFLERGGPATESFELSFKRDEMNDVLKTLAVWVARGSGRVGTVAFEAPEDPNDALAERNLDFEQGEVGLGLLHALRGRSVAVDDGGEIIRGEVVGVQETPGGERPPRRQLLLRTTAAELRIVDLADTKRLELGEGPSQADVEFLIDRSRAASSGENRSVRVLLDGTAEDLRLAYVVPAPVWRVSYRLVTDGEDARLMAWAIVHNPADEDLEGVDLTLTTGQPVSFVIDLYEAKHVQRAVVEEQSRAAAAPHRFERAYAAAPPAAMAYAADEQYATDMPPPPPGMGPAPMAGGPPPPPMAAPAPAAPPPRRAMAQALAESAEGGAEGEDRGEFFEYRVSGPVSLKRGGSAMVPLGTSEIAASKRRIWREDAGPNPDLVLEFDNDTGLVLEEGPVVIYDEGTYAGESMLPYSCRNVEVKLAFAKDLAVRCQRDASSHFELQRIELGSEVLLQEHVHRLEHELRAESDHDEPVEVIFELRKVHGRDLDEDGPQPFEETSSYRRFRVEVEPHGKAELRVCEHWLSSRHVQYSHVSAAALEEWLEGRLLDRKAFEQLSAVLSAWSEMNELNQQYRKLEQLQQGAYDKQSKISEQLGVLREGGKEGHLRLRYVEELGAEQDKVNSLESEMHALMQRIEALRDGARRRLESLAER